jgi:AcrR family transcriptional regulator
MSSPRRQRRRPEEIRALILDAARELFERQGYDATTTKDIARRAGVLESLLFTNFGSKAALFDAAVVGPFADLVAGHAAAWTRDDGKSPPESRQRELIEGLFDLAERHRTLLFAALVKRAQEGRADESEDILDHLAGVLHGVAGFEAARDYPEVDAPVAVAVLAASVFGLVLLEDMVFPRGSDRPDRARVMEELTQTMAFGILNRPTHGLEKKPRRRLT